MDFDAFISYSSKDKPAADAACAVLESSGIRCWIAPRDVMPGGEYGAAIMDAIERCRVMVLIFSSNANQSPQIRREIERAVNKGATIIPVRIEEVEPTQSMAYFLGAIHWLDAMSPPLERHLQHLAETIKAILRTRAERAGADEPKAAYTLPPNPPRASSAARSEAAAPSRRWIAPAALGIVLLAAAIAAGSFFYNSKPQAKHPLGPPLDGWTLSGPAESILRYYPSPSQEDCRA